MMDFEEKLLFKIHHQNFHCSFMKAILFTLTAFILMALPVVSKAHDIHVSISEVRWNEETSSFEVAVKIFIDDLELALKQDGITGLSIGTPKESADAHTHISAYLKKHFKIELDGVVLDHDFLGKEMSEDLQAIWCYIEIKTPGAFVRNVKLTNDILLELYDDQRNIMDIRMNKQHKAYTILSADQRTWTYSS